MLEASQPWSCRQAAKVLGVSRHTIHRWRHLIIGALPAEPDRRLAGIIEADEASQRESRKGSREWVRHERDPGSHPRPPRQRWSYYERRRRFRVKPPGGWKRWQRPLLAATDRSAHRLVEAIPDASTPAIAAALLPAMAPDAILCTDGHPSYERLAKDQGIAHRALVSGERSKHTPRAYHINTVNGLIGRFRDFMRPFRGPSTRYLGAYGRWFAARDNADRNYAAVFRQFVDTQPLANTLR